MPQYRTEEIEPGVFQVLRDDVLVAFLDWTRKPRLWYGDLATVRGAGNDLPAAPHPQAWRCWDVEAPGRAECLRMIVVNVEYILAVRNTNDGPKRKWRRCLKCQNDFMSDGPHNRICWSCNTDSAGYKEPTKCAHTSPTRRAGRTAGGHSP